MDTRLLREAHHIIVHLEEEILDRQPNIDKLLIHYEPESKDRICVATPIDVASKEYPTQDAKLSRHFGEAPYFALIIKDYHSGKVSIRDYLKNPYVDFERHKGVKAAELLSEKGVDEVVTLADLKEKGSGYALEALQIDVAQTGARTLQELLEQQTQNLAITYYNDTD
jgi:predicted Fe-Mo cluster-binding NifX family protein